MEIRIDTMRDSKEDIKKAIHFLKTIVGEAQDTSGSSPASSFDSSPGAVDAMSMFSNQTAPTDTTSESVDIFGNALSKDSHGNSDKKNPPMKSDKITIIPY